MALDWRKAKKIILFALVVLNAVLFFMNRYYNSNYRLSQSEENAVYDILSRDGVGMYTDLIKEYKPMRQLDVTVTSPEADELRQMFFDDGDKVETEIELDRIEMRSYSAELVAEDSKLNYSCPTGTGELKGVGKDAAKKLSESFIKKLGDSYTNYVLDRIIYKNGGYQLEYYEHYKGYKVFCNYCIFFVDDNGIKTIEAENYTINGFVEMNREICASSEAVLTYIGSNADKSIKGTFIEDMELGYDLKESETVVDGSKIRLVPCYYIHLLNDDEPFIVYAYGNKAKDLGETETYDSGNIQMQTTETAG